MTGIAEYCTPEEAGADPRCVGIDGKAFKIDGRPFKAVPQPPHIFLSMKLGKQWWSVGVFDDFASAEDYARNRAERYPFPWRVAGEKHDRL